MIKVITLTGTLSNTGKYGISTVLGCDIVDQLLNQNGLSYTCSSEQTGLTAFLIRAKQIDYLDGKLRTRGVALVPLELYFNEDGRVKLLLGLGRGKKLYDKREDMAKRDMQREIDRALKQRSR